MTDRLPCPPELWPRFSRLLDLALDLPPAERRAWLEALGGDDAPVVPWLRDVLERSDGPPSTDFLDGPPLLLVPARPDATADPQPGQRLGPWRLRREIGRGGMGTVWLASRDDGAYQRDVALKLPHAHLLAGAVKVRFERERNILAGLEHPHIARFYDAGLGEGGQPWLALEYVDGRTLTDYCKVRGLDVRARVRLLRDVALAVQAAHARLIVHRDLKPANVLVDGDGLVKLLDFGIAKLLDDPEAGALSVVLGGAATPSYAAPEQLSGGAITVATDVYALGVMLYELLTGKRPFETASGLGRFAAVLGGAPPASAGVQGARRRELQGDLDAILAKALEAEPGRRYASAEAFAADLARYLAHEPVAAARLSPWRRALKFSRRHRGPLAAAALVLVVLGAGVGGVLWEARETQRQAQRAEAVKKFLVEVYSASDPRIASDRPRGQITARELLDLSADKIEPRFAGQPEVQIELLRTAAVIFRELGEEARYEGLQRRHLELVRQYHGPLHPAILEGVVEAAERAAVRNDWPACERLLRDADDLLRRAGADRSLTRARWWNVKAMLARAQPGGEAPAVEAVRQALALHEALAPGQEGHITTLNTLAASSWADPQASIALYREALALASRLPEHDDAELQLIWGNLGVTYQQVGRLAEAAAAFERSAELAARTRGPDHIDAQFMRAQAARTLHLVGDRDRALALFRALDDLVASDRTDSDVSFIRVLYGASLTSEGRPALAIPMLEEAQRGIAKQSWIGGGAQIVGTALGIALDEAGRDAEARRVLTSVVEAPTEPGNAPGRRERLGRVLLDLRELDAAEAQFQAELAAAKDANASEVALARGGLSAVALARGDTPRALAESELALAVWGRHTGFYDVRYGPYLQRRRADVLVAAGRIAEAQALEDEAWAASARYDAPESGTRKRRTFAK